MKQLNFLVNLKLSVALIACLIQFVVIEGFIYSTVSNLVWAEADANEVMHCSSADENFFGDTSALLFRLGRKDSKTNKNSINIQQAGALSGFITLYIRYPILKLRWHLPITFSV